MSKSIDWFPYNSNFALQYVNPFQANVLLQFETMKYSYIDKTLLYSICCRIFHTFKPKRNTGLKKVKNSFTQEQMHRFFSLVKNTSPESKIKTLKQGKCCYCLFIVFDMILEPRMLQLIYHILKIHKTGQLAN